MTLRFTFYVLRFTHHASIFGAVELRVHIMSARVGTSPTDDRQVELTFWARELQDAPALDAPAGDGAVRAAAPDEVALLLEAKGAEGYDEALRWLAYGHRPYVALTRGVVRAYGWVASTDVYIGDLERDIHLAP